MFKQNKASGRVSRSLIGEWWKPQCDALQVRVRGVFKVMVVTALGHTIPVVNKL
jgi:hypothetical protein